MRSRHTDALASPPVTLDLDRALLDGFGLSAFRPGQRRVIEAVLSGRPTLAVMPTGAGKSLCYQLPAVALGGTALVVSPLIALMKDQVDALLARGISAAAVSSALAPAALESALGDLAEGRLRLAYVAPERFKSSRFTEALARLGDRLSLLAIDEAHCISEWGHDFRPDYMRIGEVAARIKPPRLVALTATATPEVQRDIVKQLGMEDPAVFVRGFDRPNLRFTVERAGGVADKSTRLVALVRRAPGAAIVYAATRKNVELYAARLASAKVRAGAYHAGLGDEERTRTQEQFMAGELDVLVATNAFGMGVDKADVRLVVHADLPRSCEAYYQEAGRAGRDGAPADCVLLFQHGDVKLQEFLIEASTPRVELLRAIWRLLRDDPHHGVNPAAARRHLPGEPGDAQVGTAVRFLLRAGHLREVEGVIEAVRPGDDGPPPAPIDAAVLGARAEVERTKLRAMVAYAYASSCRRRYILDYFGDEDARAIAGCSACDVCLGAGRRALSDEERAGALAALTLVERLRGRFGRTRLAGVLAGVDDDARMAECPERGVLRREGVRWALDLLRALEGAGLIEQAPGEYPTLAITRAGRQAMVSEGAAGDRAAAGVAGAGGAGQRPLELALTSAPAAGARAKRGEARGAAASGGRAAGNAGAAGRAAGNAGAAGRAGDDCAEGPADPAIVERLRAFRSEVARAEGMPAYVVFANRTLDALASARPSDLDGLAAVHGMGPMRIERYGARLLAVLRDE